MGEIGKVRKNCREVIKVIETEFKGHRFIDLRSYYEEDGTGELKPTKKGICLGLDTLPAVIKFLQQGIKLLEKDERRQL